MAEKHNVEILEAKYFQALESGKKYAKMFEKAKTFVQNRQEDLTELMAFYQGSQYNLASYENNKPWVVQMNTPHASTIVDTRVSSLIALDYVGVIEPYSPEDKDAVDTLQDILEDFWSEIGLNQKISDAIHTGAVVREGYIHFTYNKNKIYGGTKRLMKGGIEAQALDTSHVYLDPDARDFEKCEYICVTERINKNLAIKRYPLLTDHVGSGISSPESRGEIYNINDYTTSQEDVLTKITVYYKDYDNKGENFVIKRAVLVENALVEEETLDGLHRFPIAQFRWKKCEDSAYGLSLMDDILCLQKAVNAIESAITNTAIAYASPSFVMNRTCGVSPVALAQSSGAPGAVYVVDGDPSNSIVPLIPPKIDDKIVTIKSEFEQSMNTIAGITGSYIGSLGTAGNTASSAEMAIDRAKIIEALAISNIEKFVKQITLIMCDYLITMYSGKSNIYTRKRNDNGNIEFRTHSLPKSIEKADFSFYIDLSARTKFSIEQQERTIKELYQQERQYDSPTKLINELDVLEASGLRNKKILKDRYERELAFDAQSKAQLINKMVELGNKYGIAPELVQNAEMEIIQENDPSKMPNVNLVLQQAEQASVQMEQQIQQSNDNLAQMGFSPEEIDEASQEVLKNGVNQQMF